MKKLLVSLLVILVVFPLFLGGLLWFTYKGVAESSIPMPQATLLETPLSPTGYEWHTPVFGGMVYKDFYKASPTEMEDLGQITAPSVNVEAPAGFSSTGVLSKEGTDVWSGQADDLSEYLFLESGQYELQIDSRREMESGKGYGSLQYRATFSVVADLRLEQGADALAQGDGPAAGTPQDDTAQAPKSAADEMGENPAESTAKPA